MALVTSKELLLDAQKNHYAIGAFNVENMEMVQAVIEVKVQPQRDRGFDAIAARIYRFEEVKSLYLMSGAYDLMVMLEARTLKELAHFVHSKLSVIDGVTGTATHFMLKTYKYGGVIFEDGAPDRRLAVSP